MLANSYASDKFVQSNQSKIPVLLHNIRTPPRTRSNDTMTTRKFVSFSSPSDKMLSPITKGLIGCHGVKVGKKERAIFLSTFACLPKEGKKPNHQKTLFKHGLCQKELENNKENNTSSANINPHEPKPKLTPKTSKVGKTWPSPSDKIVSPINEALIGIVGQKVSKKERAKRLSKFSLEDISEEGVISSEQTRVKKTIGRKASTVTFEEPIIKGKLKRTPKKARHNNHPLPVIRYHSPSDEIVSPITKALVGCGGRKATNKQKMKELSACFPAKQIYKASQPLSVRNDLEQKHTIKNAVLKTNDNTPVSKRALLASRSAIKSPFPLYVEGSPELKKSSKFFSPSDSPLSVDVSKFSKANGENNNLPPLVKRSSRKTGKGLQKKMLSERGNVQPSNKQISVLSPLPINVHRR